MLAVHEDQVLCAANGLSCTYTCMGMTLWENHEAGRLTGGSSVTRIFRQGIYKQVFCVSSHNTFDIRLFPPALVYSNACKM